MTVDCRQKALARKVFLLVSHRQSTYLAAVMEVKVFLFSFSPKVIKVTKMVFQSGIPQVTFRPNL